MLSLASTFNTATTAAPALQDLEPANSTESEAILASLTEILAAPQCDPPQNVPKLKRNTKERRKLLQKEAAAQRAASHLKQAVAMQIDGPYQDPLKPVWLNWLYVAPSKLPGGGMGHIVMH